MKRKFKVSIKRVESCAVVVSADDEEQAKDMALELEAQGMIEMHTYEDECAKVEPMD